MRLYLMRHGVAIDRDDPDCPSEAERYLTPRGIERTREVAEGLARLRIHPMVLLTSPLVRAVQTCEIVCEVLELDSKSIHASDALKPEAKPSRIAEELSRLPERSAIPVGPAAAMAASTSSRVMSALVNSGDFRSS